MEFKEITQDKQEANRKIIDSKTIIQIITLNIIFLNAPNKRQIEHTHRNPTTCHVLDILLKYKDKQILKYVMRTSTIKKLQRGYINVRQNPTIGVTREEDGKFTTKHYGITHFQILPSASQLIYGIVTI